MSTRDDSPIGVETSRPRRRGRVIVMVGLLVVAVPIAPQLALIAMLVRPARAPAPAPAWLVEAAVAAGGFEQVEFRTDDHLTLRGEFLGGADRPVVIYGHSFRGSRREGDRLAGVLLRRGWSLLQFDFRAHGDSDGAVTAVGAVEAADVAAAVRYVTGSRGVPARRVCYVGASLGAAAGALAATALKDLAGVALIAAYGRLVDAVDARTRRLLHVPFDPWFIPAGWIFARIHDVDPAEVSPIAAASSLTGVNTLWIAGSDDWRAPPAPIGDLRDRAGAASRLWVVDGADHVAMIRLADPVLSEVVRFVTAAVADAR